VSDLGILPAIAAIGMSLAGFAGLVTAILRSRGDWQPGHSLMIQTQVFYGFCAVVLALGPVPLAGLLGVEPTLHGASVVLFTCIAGWGAHAVVDSRRAGIGWRRRLPFSVVGPPALTITIWSIVTGQQLVYELALVLLLVLPMPVFFLAISEIGRPRD
jgi:hypothetical protein